MNIDCDDYSIENLIKIFALHDRQSTQDRENQIAQYKIDFPGTPLPKYYENDFSIARALNIICKEIAKIKKS